MKKKEQTLYFVNILFDFLLLNISYFILLMIKNRLVCDDDTKMLFIIFNLAWLVAILFAPYQIRIHDKKKIKIELLRGLIFTALLTFILFITKFPEYSRLIILGTVVLFIFLNSLFDIVVRPYIFNKFNNNKNRLNLIIIGAGKKGIQFFNFILNNKDLGYNIVGFLDDYKTSLNKYTVWGPTSSLEKIIKDKEIDEVIVALPLMGDIIKQKEIVEVCDKLGVRLRILPDYYRLLGKEYTICRFGEIPVINYEEYPLDNFLNYCIKRTFDIIFASVMLILLSPLLLAIALLIILESKGPLFYKPKRVGERGKRITVIKFRTMYDNDDEENGINSTIKDDPRITKVGKIIRRSNLDELPQFVNILKGDMSVVGPRPHRIWLENDFQEVVKEYLKRHYIKPGLTGWAQVNGWRGPTDTLKQKEQRVAHDLYYIKNWSFLFDMKIILNTIFKKSSWKNAF